MDNRIATVIARARRDPRSFIMHRKKGNMKKVTYTEAQIQTIMSLLDSLITTGVQNAKRIAVIAQTLDAGSIEDEKEGE